MIVPLASDKVVVAYHYPCPDGIFAALAAHLHFRLHPPPTALRFLPLTVYKQHTVHESKLEGVHLFMCDFAGPPGFVQDASCVAAKVTVLDHHKTALEALSTPEVQALPNVETVLDMHRSGATIARDYFRPEGMSEAHEQLFQYIEDADLWRWQLKDSKAFHAGLGALGLEYDVTANPGIFDRLLSLTPDYCIAKGLEVLAEQQAAIRATLATAYAVQLGGRRGADAGWGRCLAVRADAIPQLRSALGNDLAELSAQQGMRAVGVVAYVEEAMADAASIKVSLRSKGVEDTTVVSQAYGGGGHCNASSCIVTLEEFEDWRH